MKKAKLGHAYKEEPFQVWLLGKKRILFKFLGLIVQVKETENPKPTRMLGQDASEYLDGINTQLKKKNRLIPWDNSAYSHFSELMRLLAFEHMKTYILFL